MPTFNDITLEDCNSIIIEQNDIGNHDKPRIIKPHERISLTAGKVVTPFGYTLDKSPLSKYTCTFNDLEVEVERFEKIQSKIANPCIRKKPYRRILSVQQMMKSPQLAKPHAATNANT